MPLLLIPALRMATNGSLIAVAVVLAVVASISFASGATAQHIGVDRALGTDSADRRLTFSHLVTLLKTPIWLGGLGLVALGACIHLVAVFLAPITVVQPLGILAVVWSVLLAARIHRSTPTRTMWAAVGVSIVGIVLFTLLSTRHAADHGAVSLTHLLLATLVVWAVAGVFSLVGWRGPRWTRSLAWSWAGAVLYGLGTGYMKTMTVVIRNGTLTGPEFWVALVGLALAYGIGGWLIQQGYATGPAEVVVGSMTTIDPLAAVVVGLVVLGEGAQIGPFVGLGMAFTGAVAAGGVAVLSRFHPDTQRHLDAYVPENA